MDYNDLSVKLHKKYRGKLEVVSNVPLKNKYDLSLAHTPGVAQPCLEIYNDPEKVYELTGVGKTIAIVSDGSAVLGLGNLGSKASLPVMEGKGVIFKELGGVSAFPIVLDSQDPKAIIESVKQIAPSFGGINLEDISAPRCFEIEETLKKELDIPVFHDDQHGTAIVVLAGLLNALKITQKTKDIKIVINGSGAAGTAITKLLYDYGFKNVILCDRKGALSKNRIDELPDLKKEIVKITNPYNENGTVYDVMTNADVFIGVSAGNILKKEHIKVMNYDPALFVMANPIPEIMPDEAKEGGAKIIATGRSDFPNQLNNMLVFPGIFKGALRARAKDITTEMKISAAEGIAKIVENPSYDCIIPDPFDKRVPESVANAVESCYTNSKK